MINKQIKVVGTTFHPLPHTIKLKPSSVSIDNDIPVAVFPALLLPEPTNPYDPQAVEVVLPTTEDAVFVVGYVPRDEPLKTQITVPTMAEVVIKDYRSVGNYNPSYTITKIEMEEPSC